MAESIFNRFIKNWNIFNKKDKIDQPVVSQAFSMLPDRPFRSYANERTIITSIINRIAIDVASLEFKHVVLDDNHQYKSDVDSSLNNCLSVEANKDQTGRALIQEAVLRMCDTGSVAIVPINFSKNPFETTSYDIRSLRCGTITAWYPDFVTVLLYNDITGNVEEVTLPKRLVSIIENPLRTVMNEPNSTLKRLIHKLSLLDAIDNQSGSGKLDLIIQLPYSTRSELRKAQAEERKKEIEFQLTDHKYGIAYIDATEKVTQLNRPVENNLLTQVEYLTKMLYMQLGLDEGIFTGTADARTTTNYNNKTIEPIASAIVNELRRKFLTKTARSQNQSIIFSRNPFKLIPEEQVATVMESLTRNEIISSNEARAILGYKPVDSERANALMNKNLNHENDSSFASTNTTSNTDDKKGISKRDLYIQKLLNNIERKR